MIYSSEEPLFTETENGVHIQQGLQKMGKKKETLDLRDYVTAHDAAQLLSIANERPIHPEYVAKMAKMQKYTIRTYPLRGRYLYHRGDIMACRIHQAHGKQLTSV